ncbi:MAG: cbb3-type cytochrome c oxidase subunit I, partial [Candidatus Omnitrophica bacterium]|nr:cbb3-type cytochrome c oxidase subunit I [Candidatus Omnitrophota bacterium]
TTGMSPLLGKAFMFLTLLISIPSSVFFLNWLATLWKGSIRFTVPMLFTLSVVFVFALGGLTGLYLATVTSDIYLHDSMFVVGHFHYTLAASVLMASFAAIYYWYPKMFGKKLNTFLGHCHFWVTFASLNMVFYNMMAAGYAGQHRRLFDPFVFEFLQPLKAVNFKITMWAFMMGTAQLFLLINIIWTWLKGKKADKNPWEAATLEWTVDYPVPHGNFSEIPTVHTGPHEYSHPSLTGRDWIPQTEALK